VHHASGKSATYGSLAAAAARLKAPEPKKVTLKDSENLQSSQADVASIAAKIVRRRAGVRHRRRSAGISMPCSRNARCRRFGQKPQSRPIKKLPGIKDAFIVKGGSAQVFGSQGGRSPRGYAGLAIVADSWWRAGKSASCAK